MCCLSACSNIFLNPLLEIILQSSSWIEATHTQSFLGASHLLVLFNLIYNYYYCLGSYNSQGNITFRKKWETRTSQERACFKSTRSLGSLFTKAQFFFCSEGGLIKNAINCNDIANMPKCSFILALEATKSSHSHWLHVYWQKLRSSNIGKGIKYTRANVKWKWSPGYTKCAAILTHQKKDPPFLMWHRRHFLQIVMGKTDIPYFAEQPNLLKLYFHQEYLSHLCQSCLIPAEGVQIGWQMKVQLYVLFCFVF